jgi:hypothetical protein
MTSTVRLQQLMPLLVFMLALWAGLAAACSSSGPAGGGGGAGGTQGAAGASGSGGAGGDAGGATCSTCDPATTYCQSTVGGAVGAPGSYVCKPLPAGCGSNPTCACLTGGGCGTCTMTAGGVLTVTCQTP